MRNGRRNALLCHQASFYEKTTGLKPEDGGGIGEYCLGNVSMTGFFFAVFLLDKRHLVVKSGGGGIKMWQCLLTVEEGSRRNDERRDNMNQFAWASLHLIDETLAPIFTDTKPSLLR